MIETGAVLPIPDSHPDKPLDLKRLGVWWLRRYQRLGNISDIENACADLKLAVRLTPDGDPDKSGCLNNLGVSWHARFERLGDLADIDKAIECYSQAVQFTPNGHPDKPSRLSNLGVSWQTRFERLGDLADIGRAIECHSQGVQLTPDGHPDKTSLLHNMGSSWQARFERLGDLADIDKAIECYSQAIETTPDGHPNKPGYLSNLGYSWQKRFERLGDLADIDKAIECHSQAVKLTPDGHPDKSGRLNNIANSWQARFERLGDPADIDKAIECYSQAIETTPDGHPNKPGYLSNLGYSWQRQFEQNGRVQDLEASLKSFQSGAELIVISPNAQLVCARNWAKQSLRLGRSPLSAYQRAFALLPQLVSLGQTIRERYDSLLSISDLAAEAAAWAMSVQRHDFALECLEQGRSVVWSQTLQLRTPFDELAKVNSGLADNLRDTAYQLDVASSRPRAANLTIEPQQDLESQAQRHRHLAALWDGLLTEARQLPGFEGFMLPRASADLKKAATNGPVVVINTHSTRCDALVIFPECGDVVHVPFNGLANKQLMETCLKVMSLVGHRGNGARSVKYFPSPVESQDDLQPLKDLWSNVVGPVLNVLALTHKPSYNQLPHVTWCATGALSFLPLHAAGLYDGHSPNAFDLVVSSYTPTLSALLPRNDQAVEQTQGFLVVGQANTHGQPPLPMTVQELAIVKKHTKLTFYHQLDGASATVDATLNAMEQHSWVHLACHAVQNRDNPSHSAFYLHDGCLTLEEIAKRQFKNKGLAFLSACQTATGDNRLPDEATHLAAGMLIAGYPSVIATMWSIWDDDAPQVTEEVYAELMRDGAMDHKRAAIALHKAVGKLREKVGLESIGRWAPFIHVGV